MFQVHVISPLPQCVFAAEELRKYLRMMMPRCGAIPLDFSSEESGFRVGLMKDFGLDMSDAEKPELDDIVFLQTASDGGIIAGSNPIALLIAVYRYLRFQGARWLFPGVDGEWIPVIPGLKPVDYRKKADHRYRGQCNEGAEFQANMMETIDFTPKIGLNTYMLEFDIPFCYYNSYYTHDGSPNRVPEPVNNTTVLQWKRECEAEIQKRGLHFHDMGHGWTAEPFGLDSKLRVLPTDTPPETMGRLAMLNGKRDFYHRVIDTNFCMSNPENRGIVARYIADYAETQNNVDFLHIWLADATNNHCECEECRKKIVPDWYVILLNEIDAELTRRNLPTHLVFIVYTETMWAPVTEELRNPDRFTMLYAPIHRLYTETYGEKPDPSCLVPFQLNHNRPPKGMSECLAYLQEWKKHWSGDCFCYEYHFWRHQYYDPSGMYLSRLLHDDVAALRQNGLQGIVEDGSQRSYFPNGLAFYTYGETLFDASLSFDSIVEDYFSHAYGENWEQVRDYLNSIRECLDFAYLSGLRSSDPDQDRFRNPDMKERVLKVHELNREFRPVIEANRNQDMRASSVLWQLLGHFADYSDGLARIIACRCVGDSEQAALEAQKLYEDFSLREPAIERWFDQYLSYYSLKPLFTKQN